MVGLGPCVSEGYIWISMNGICKGLGQSCLKKECPIGSECLRMRYLDSRIPLQRCTMYVHDDPELGLPSGFAQCDSTAQGVNDCFISAILQALDLCNPAEDCALYICTITDRRARPLI